MPEMYNSDVRECKKSAPADSRADGVRLSRRILMMVTVVPPVPIAGAFVVKGLLSELGPNEVAIAAERWPTNPIDQTCANNGHRVHFVGNYWCGPRRGRRFVEWTKWFLVPRMARRLIKLAQQEKCDGIFAIFPDQYCLGAAFFAARRLGLKFFPFFHNTYRENRHGLEYVAASWLQSRVFKHSEVVFVMSEGMGETLKSRYPNVDFRPLIHTFEGTVPAFHSLAAIDRARIRLGYMGSISEANAEALRRICDVVNESSNLELNMYTQAAEWHLRSAGLVGARIHRHWLPDEELRQGLQSNDILILPHGLSGGLEPIEYQTIFPTRTILYLLSGRPILAHSARDSFLSRWLRQHDCAELVEDPDPGALRAAINRLCADEARREQLVRNSLRAAEQFRADRVVNEMKRTINCCWSESPSKHV